MDYKDMKFRMWNGCDRGLCCKAVGRQDRQLNTYDWLADVPGNAESTDLVIHNNLILIMYNFMIYIVLYKYFCTMIIPYLVINCLY